MGSLPQGHRGWRKRRCGPLPWGHWQGGRVSDYPHAQQRTASKALPTGPGAEAARLPHRLALTPSISEFIWRKGAGLMKLHREGRLGGTSGAYGIGVPWVGLVFLGGWPFDRTACQRRSLRGQGGGRDLRQRRHHLSPNRRACHASLPRDNMSLSFQGIKGHFILPPAILASMY